MNKVVVENIRMGDVEDPYLMAGFPLAEWEKTDKAQWIMAHSQQQPVYHCTPDVMTMGYKITVTAYLTEESEAIMYLRWGKP